MILQSTQQAEQLGKEISDDGYLKLSDEYDRLTEKFEKDIASMHTADMLFNESQRQFIDIARKAYIARIHNGMEHPEALYLVANQ